MDVNEYLDYVARIFFDGAITAGWDEGRAREEASVFALERLDSLLKSDMNDRIRFDIADHILAAPEL